MLNSIKSSIFSYSAIPNPSTKGEYKPTSRYKQGCIISICYYSIYLITSNEKKNYANSKIILVDKKYDKKIEFINII